MRKVIAYLKLGALTVFTLSFWSFYMIILGLIRLTPYRYERWRNFFMRNWSRAAALIFNIRIKTEGEPPKAPFFVVCNHMGYLDIIPLFLTLRCTFVAKKEVRGWPVLGKMVDSVGVIFIDRNRRTDVKRVNERITNSLNKYQGLIVFPEGTSTGGFEVKDFHASLLQYPAATNRPVHAVSLHYETAPGDKPAVESVCFFGGRESFGSHVVKFAQNKRTYCTIRFRKETIQSTDRKELAVKLHDAVDEIFTPTSVKEEAEPAEVAGE